MYRERKKYVKVDMKWLGLVNDNAHNGDKWMSSTTGTKHCLSAIMRV